MEIGIDSFAKKTLTNQGGTVDDDAKAMSELIERIVHADKVGIDVFGLGEHHRDCLLYTSPSPRDGLLSRMPSSA